MQTINWQTLWIPEKAQSLHPSLHPGKATPVEIRRAGTAAHRSSLDCFCFKKWVCHEVSRTNSTLATFKVQVVVLDAILWFLRLCYISISGSEKLQILFEQWVACEGAWSSSEFFIMCRKKSKNRHRGARAWLTRSEIEKKYGSAQVADHIVTAKLNDPELFKTHVRPHPDMNGKLTPETCLH